MPSSACVRGSSASSKHLAMKGKASEQVQSGWNPVSIFCDGMVGSRGTRGLPVVESSDAWDLSSSCDHVPAGPGTVDLEPDSLRRVSGLGVQDAQVSLGARLERPNS